jgi:predicted esterase
VNIDPHRAQPAVRYGPDPAAARLTIVAVHGRGASAADILSVAHELAFDDVAFVAPEAAGHTWYPYSFLSPLSDNEPHLSSALALLDRIVGDLQREAAPERIGLLGFSQGACLCLEFAARHARRYAAIAGFSGGLIGPPGTPRDYSGAMERTPVFLGCSDIDPHIPLARVHETANVFGRMGAAVDERIYPRMGHLVNQDEIDAVRTLLSPAPRQETRG